MAEDPTVDEALRAFVAERDWGQFHTPANLAKSIAIEAGELLECFQWSNDSPRDRIMKSWQTSSPTPDSSPLGSKSTRTRSSSTSFV
jgi:hypothetical protein